MRALVVIAAVAVAALVACRSDYPRPSTSNPRYTPPAEANGPPTVITQPMR